ncbi:MAG: BLUF domain-containing protein [Woeseiaceae bacterium]|nr:BLUF domain-containing protein [Woeseiaceae bacterium]
MVYVSTAVAPMRDQDLAELLVQARSRNERNAVTGMLLYKDGRFIQLLEGHEEKVQQSFERIRQDERHTAVELLWLRYAQYRDFPDWTMGFVNADELDPATLKGYSAFLERDLRYEEFIENSTEVHEMLKAFKEDPLSLV